MAFEKTVPVWNAPGAEPPEALKNAGFQVGYKPPADYFNWFWHGVSQSLLELQNGALSGGTGIDISGQNLISAISGKSGFFRGVNVTNAPDQYWWYYLAVAGSDTTNVIAFGIDCALKAAQFRNDATSIEWNPLGGVEGILSIAQGGTGASTASAAANSLGVATLLTGTAINADSEQDLNNYKTVGNYCCGQSSTAGALLNCPTYNAFTMKVFYANGSNWYIGQEILDYSTGVRYYRLYKQSSDTWEDWKHTFNSAKKPSASDIQEGVFPTTNIKAATGTDYTTGRVRNIWATVNDLTAGSSSLANGNIALIYE